MSWIQKRGPVRRVGGAVVWLAVLLFALAPAVNALCALGAPGGNSGTGALQAAMALEDGTGRDDGCCAAMSAPVIESTKPFGVSLGGSLQPVGPFVPAPREMAVHAFSVVHPLSHLPAPPPEPVSRRFPRLLI